MSGSMRPKTCRTLPCRTFRPRTFNDVKLLTQKERKIQGNFVWAVAIMVLSCGSKD
jgi:hypothetical protein